MKFSARGRCRPGTLEGLTPRPQDLNGKTIGCSIITNPPRVFCAGCNGKEIAGEKSPL